MRRTMVHLLLLSIVTRGTPLAQTIGALRNGARVRVTSRSGMSIAGELVSLDSDRLVLTPDDLQLADGPSATVAVARTQIRAIDVSQGRHSNAGKGALLGFAIAGGLGALLAAESCAASTSWFDPSPGACAATGGVIFGVLGAGLGAAIGAGSRSDTWQSVALASLHVGFGRGGPEVAFSVPVP